MNRIFSIVAGVLVALLLANSMVFVVDQRQYAVIYQLGEIKEVVTEPGLKLKLPMIQNVVFMDRRVQTLDSTESSPIFTAEKKSLVVDWLVKWRITDPRAFIRNTGANLSNLEARLIPIVQAALNEEVTKRTVQGVLATEREAVMRGVARRVIEDSKQFGIEITDVRVKRVDFSANIVSSVYGRMTSERQRVANELRATGAAEADKIRADAERQREVIIAEAYRDAQRIKGEGDAKASALYADSFGRDANFAQFYRSLEAYRAAFRNKNDVMVIDPSSEFFKSMRTGGPGGATAPAAKK